VTLTRFDVAAAWASCTGGLLAIARDSATGTGRSVRAAISTVDSCGNDAGGWATGGYASGLAAALVLGLVAAESAAEDSA